MKNKKLLLIILITAIIVLFASSFIYFKLSVSKTAAVMDKGEYKANEDGRIKIRNGFSGKICFSSCYPFYFDKENSGTWQGVKYDGCVKDDLAEKCVDINGTKAFKCVFPDLEAGNYRLAIPVCNNCNENDKFISNDWIYTNTFKIIK
ncbi:MAG: hypothetical protein NT148_01130 [Candidatus Nealsonbacteria bacterium]|nr:hypothetical protein [Candidatus Nealsonbacteria bacterium]